MTLFKCHIVFIKYLCFLNWLNDMSAYLSLFGLFFYLGCISFGGPTAHIALFQQELIEKRKWMNAEQYTQLVAICQFLPGPSSSQVGMALGFYQKGYLGALLAWLGFTLPSAILLCAIAIGAMNLDLLSIVQLLHALKVAACAIVAFAVYSMMRQICTQRQHYAVMLMIAIGCWYFSSTIGQWLWIMLGAVIGVIAFQAQGVGLQHLDFKISTRVGCVCLALFFTLLMGLGVMAHVSTTLAFVDIFYQAGAWVFGGGHVVLPLLQDSIVGQNLLNEDLFLAGYGIVQAMPGPLFNFASYLGAVLMPTQPIYGAILATVMIFIPAALILFGTLPFIQKVAQLAWLNTALIGVNAAVVGILLATFFDPVLVGSLQHWWDVIVAIILFMALYFKKLPVWGVVLLSGAFYMLLF